MHGENYHSYPSYSAAPHLYLTHCKQQDIIPVKHRFFFHDVIRLHSIIYNYSCNKLPYYLTYFNGSRLRSSHYDELCLVSSINPKVPVNLTSSNSISGFQNSYFYRSHLLWNRLPLELRQIKSMSVFRSKLLQYIWDCEISAEYKSMINDGDISEDFAYDTRH